MAWVKLSAVLLIVGVLAGFLHHYLPSHDVVRVVRTETVRVDETGTDGQGNEIVRTRDQNRIYTFTPEGDERVYRNEDTGWGFPWYLKFDTANLAAAAEDAVSTKDDPSWMVVRHYGWRIPVFSMFPNALSMRPAEGPDESLTPWFNIVLLSCVVLALLVLRRILLIARQSHLDPAVERIDAEIDDAMGWWRRLWRRLAGGD